MTLFADRHQTVVVSFDKNALRETGVQHTRENTLVDMLVILVRGNHRGQLFVVAMIEELIELFPSPRCRLLGTQIIKNQQMGIADLLESFVVGNAVLQTWP